MFRFNRLCSLIVFEDVKGMFAILSSEIETFAQRLIFPALGSVNAMVYTAKGVPQINVYLNLVNISLLPLSFFIAAQYGLIYVAVPWITLYPLIRIGQTWLALRLLSLRISSYLEAISHPICAVASMMVILVLFRSIYFWVIEPQKSSEIVYIIATLVLGAASYVGYYALFQRNVILVLWELARRREHSSLPQN